MKMMFFIVHLLLNNYIMVFNKILLKFKELSLEKWMKKILKELEPSRKRIHIIHGYLVDYIIPSF